MNIRIFAPSLIASIIALTFAPVAAWASSASLYVSPASGAVAVGNIIPVQVRVNTGGDPVNAVQANVSYNASQLSYQSIDSTGSAFSLTANIQTGPGNVKMARAIGGGENPVRGDFLFVTMYFKALTTAGTASVAIAGDSHVVRSTDSVDIMAGAPAASGPKASADGAPKPTSYPTIAKAKEAVATMAAQATPTPQPPAADETQAPAESPQQASDMPLTQSDSAKVLSWNSPLGLGGLALLLAVIVAVSVLYAKRNAAKTAPVKAVPSPTSPSAVPSAPHGSVDTKTGIINSETVYPNSTDSNQR